MLRVASMLFILFMMTNLASRGKALMTSKGMLEGPGALCDGLNASVNSSMLVGWVKFEASGISF